MLSSMCQHVPRWHFDRCAEKHSLCGTVMIHDGLNLTCLIQCHGVRSHATSSSQSWRKRLVVESKFDPKVCIKKVMYRFVYGSLPTTKSKDRHISVFLWLRKQRPRFAQGQPKGYFQTKELHRTTQAIAQMNAD